MTLDKSQSNGLIVHGMGLCMPGDAADGEPGRANTGINVQGIPPALRRRTSIATRIAISALERACEDAGQPRDLPVIFCSSIAEMAVTDRLCQAIARSVFPLSPTLFHNSVHNTAAGYWSLTTGAMSAMQSMAGLDDSFAMGLMEAYAQLYSGVPQVLLVCFDEAMPEEFLPDYQWQACASAWVLSRGQEGGLARLSCPYRVESTDIKNPFFSEANPALAGVRLYDTIRNSTAAMQTISLSRGPQPWQLDLRLAHE